MRIGALAVAAGLALLVGGPASGSAWNASASIAEVWWTLPVAASIFSVIMLAGAAALGALWKIQSRVSTRAYLVTVPAMLSVNLSTVLPLGAPPPAWVECVMPALLAASALFYYRVTREREEPGPKATGAFYWPGYAVSANGIKSGNGTPKAFTTT